MRFYSKDKDPRLDNRDARANGRKIKTALLNNKDIISPYYGVDIMRADNRVTWDYEKDKWCSRDEMMGSCHIIAEDGAVRDSDGYVKIAEHCFDKELAFICSGVYKKAQIHSMVDWCYPVEKLAKGQSVYHIQFWIAEMGDSTERAVYEEGLKHKFFDLHDKPLLEVA